MRVLHVIPSLSPSSGGPSLALPSMAKALHARGITVDVVATNDAGPGLRMAGTASGRPQSEAGFQLRYFQKQTEFYKVSLPMATWLWQHVRDYSLIHIHAVFSFASTSGAFAARFRGVPYIIRPLGVLNTYGMEQRRQGLKEWSFRLLDKPLLDQAAAIHYTSSQERQEAARLHIRAPARVIPLGIDLAPLQQKGAAEIFLKRFPAVRGSRILLFLSRLDPKKGLELLIDSFAGLPLDDVDTKLVIAGDGPPDYVDGLKKLAGKLGVADRILWTGHLEAEDKRSAFAAATLFLLPSQSENFGIALLEAMASGLPCIASDQVALALDARQEKAVCVLPRNTAAWTSAISALLKDTAARHALGSAGASLAQEKYSLDAMGDALHTLYQEIGRAV